MLKRSDIDESFTSENYVFFIRVVEGTAPNTHKLYSMVVANLGGSQMSRELWQIVSSFLEAQSPSSKNSSNRREIVFSLQDSSDDFFGMLKIDIVSETPVQGDVITEARVGDNFTDFERHACF